MTIQASRDAYIDDMRNTVRFQSAIFNSTEPRPHFINQCCFGDDVGAWLKQKLAECGYDVEGPDQEDWGWYLVCQDACGSHYLNISHTGHEWQVIVECQRSLAEWLMRKSKDPAPELPATLHRILTADAGIEVTEWLSLDGRGRESDVAHEP